MKKIFKSLAIIVGMAVMTVAGTGAFLSDTETSVGNTFTAGAIDLKVDNESYYNGAISEHTSFPASDLDDGKLFFDFRDLKPDDEGEDTISLHVNNNDAWLCMDMSLTSDDDISSNEPELGDGDVEEDPNDTWDGELAGLLQMIWWVDDGDNVLEKGEALLSDGVQTVTDFFGEDMKFTADLADATTNVWINEPGPAEGGETYYIAKAWCFGDMIEARADQDGLGHLDDTSNGPLSVRGTGIICDGTGLDNKSQTDGLTMNIAFRAMQARHNPNYTCEQEERLATITVTKRVVIDDGGNDDVDDFQLYIQDENMNIIPVTSGFPTVVPVGIYKVKESGVSGYVRSFDGPDCDSTGEITLLEGEDEACTIVNDDLPANITLYKEVINDNGGNLSEVQFGLMVDGVEVDHNTSVSVLPNTIHSIDEVGNDGYDFISIVGISSYGKSCPDVLGGTITLDEGEAIFCTITNDDILGYFP